MTAKEMFEKLGYIKYTREFEGTNILYKNKLFCISFCNRNKTFITEYVHGDYNFPRVSPFEINMDTLKAINKQVEELGW